MTGTNNGEPGVAAVVACGWPVCAVVDVVEAVVPSVLIGSVVVDVVTGVSVVGVAVSGAEDRQAGDNPASSTANPSTVMRCVHRDRCEVLDPTH